MTSLKRLFHKMLFLPICALPLNVASAQVVPEGYFAINDDAELVSGETWKQDGQTFRLYGIQSCLRNTFYTNANGTKSDCGDVSLAVFAAYIKDTQPVCAPVARTSQVTYVSCYSIIGSDRLDLANILVTAGYAFAAYNREGEPVHTPYLVSEQYASEQRKGLWSFNDVKHPSLAIVQEWKRRQQ